MHNIHLNSRAPLPRYRRMMTCIVGVLLAVGTGPDVVRAQTSKEEAPATETARLKVQRYASLKADRVLLRQGPGTDHPIAWVFQRTGLPVAVIREFEVWRQVRDASGIVGWVHSSLLSGRRTALILPWEVKEGLAQASLATLREGDHEKSRAVAQVEAGVLASIISCRNGWCRVSVGNHRGHIQQDKLWGTHPNEMIN